ncbi:MAG TPA: class I SAM-dependent methyltransferase [Methylophilaceae bacterium]
MTQSIKPTLAEVHAALQRAWQLHQTGYESAAEQLCQQIIVSLPTQPEALHLLGVIALRDGQVELAIQRFTKALRYANKHFMLHANLGLAYHEQGNLALAERQYQLALQINPQYVDAYFNYHALKIDATNLSPSLSLLNKLLKVQPVDIEAKLSLAILLEYAGKQDEAKPYIESIEDSNLLMRERLAAWRYLQQQTPLPIICGSMMSVFELAMLHAQVEGAVLEFGVRFGNSIRQLAKLTKQPVHGFDSFEGLPENWHSEQKGSYTTKGSLPDVPKHVKLHVGWFDATLPQYLASESGDIRLINVDCDLYSSTKTVLELLAPRIVKGTVIIFDEYIGNEHWREDEFKAFQEAVKQYGWQYEYLAFSLFTKQVAVKITAT